MSSTKPSPPRSQIFSSASQEQRLGPLNPGQQDDVKILVVSQDPQTSLTICDAIRQIQGLSTRVVHAGRTEQALEHIEQFSPQVIILHVQRSLPSTMYQLSKIWNADSSVAVLAFVEPLYREHAEMLREPGLDILTLEPILHQELEWALRHGHEWTRRRRLETHITSRDRLAIAGQLTAGIVHDINNPLMAAKTNLDLAMETICSGDGLPSPEDLQALRESIADARTGVQVAQKIARDLTDFSRAPEDRHEPMDLTKVIGAALTLCAPQVRTRAKLIPDLSVVPMVQGDPSRFCQVLVNLIVNAGQAIQTGPASEQYVRVVTRFENEQVLIEIIDSGCGIPEDKIEKIFEPYYTTKPAGEGTGLGMYLSRSYIQLLGGRLEVESVVDQGTTMRIYLSPTNVQSLPNDAPTAVSPTPSQRSNRQTRMLIVDDEPLIRRAFQRAFGRDKEVLTASGGAEAIAHLETSDPFDLIFTDMMMPGMDGHQLYCEIESRWPSQAPNVVFMSGGALDETLGSNLEPLKNRRMLKNLSLQELRVFVHDLEKDLFGH